MTNNISQRILIFLKQFLNSLDKDKETLHEKMINSISQPLEPILELNNIAKEGASNSAPQLEEVKSALSALQSQPTETKQLLLTPPCYTDIEETITLCQVKVKRQFQYLLMNIVKRWHNHTFFCMIKMVKS